MLSNNLSLFRIQAGRLEQNIVWYSHLSDVVKQAAEAQFLQVTLGQTEAFAELHGTFRKGVGMSVRVRMSGFNAVREGDNHEGCLLINAALETQQRLDTAELIPWKVRRAREIRGAWLASFDQLRRSRL